VKNYHSAFAYSQGGQVSMKKGSALYIIYFHQNKKETPFKLI